MTWEQLMDSVKRGEFQNVYCFYGAEEYVKHRALEAIRQKLLPEGLEMLNETVLEGATARQLTEAAETLPLMCDRRLVIVRDWAPLMPGKAKNEAAEAELLIEWLKNTPDTCTLVFYLRGAPDGRKKAMQALQKHGAAVEFALLRDDMIFRWVRDQLKAVGKRADDRAAEMLVFLAGRELTRLSTELEKLVAFSGDKQDITKADVEKLVAPSLESTVFQMIDQLMAGDMAGAQLRFKTVLESGENRVGVLFMLTRQMRNLTHIKTLLADGMRLGEIEKKTGLARFVVANSEQQARKKSLEGLMSGYQACLDAEFRIKSGKVRDVLAVDHLMLLLGQLK